MHLPRFRLRLRTLLIATAIAGMLLGMALGDPHLSAFLFIVSQWAIPAVAFVQFRSARARGHGDALTLRSKVAAFTVGWLAMMGITAAIWSIELGLLWTSAVLLQGW
jgi:hypothetical protein